MFSKLVPYEDSSSSSDEEWWVRKKRVRAISESEDEDLPPPKLIKTEDKALPSRDIVRQYYHIEETKKRKSVLFRTDANTYKVSFKKLDIENQPANFVFTLFNDIYEQLKEKCQAKNSDKIRISIYHPSLDLGIFVPYANVSDIKGSMLLDEIQKVMQSNSELNLEDGQMTFEVTHTVPPMGSGRVPFHQFVTALESTKQ